MQNRYDSVVEILRSKANDLMSLAMLSGREPFRFYNGADLTSLDLAGQNLIGLNFDGADLRFSRLEGISYDDGSFNRSILDATQMYLKDDFEFDCHEIMGFPQDDLLAFSIIRPGLVDSLLSSCSVTYSAFTSLANVSDGSLRKARSGKVIAITTAQGIFRGLIAALSETVSGVSPNYLRLIEQPCAKLLVGGNNKEFLNISPDDLEHLLELRRRRVAFMKQRYASANKEYYDYRDTAGYLSYYKHLIDDPDFWLKFQNPEDL